ncbi:hypothetical protein GN958_ATG21525 [Phytophthora infestans]|uniref:RxLR effector protein n=1 Tax=Phytophthora infestans TaxID=4787 RepID=A0A8S9TLK6_PHYIN|nr:hypothetical protein GN958_ATG21525 [Phytophthora infestans]KAI9984497.1 hypothetical protein PInf_005855 [Phytophthora infestans]
MRLTLVLLLIVSTLVSCHTKAEVVAHADEISSRRLKGVDMGVTPNDEERGLNGNPIAEKLVKILGDKNSLGALQAKRIANAKAEAAKEPLEKAAKELNDAVRYKKRPKTSE